MILTGRGPILVVWLKSTGMKGTDIRHDPPPPHSEWNDYVGPTIRISRARKIRSTYAYDYQCVRAGRTPLYPDPGFALYSFGVGVGFIF